MCLKLSNDYKRAVERVFEEYKIEHWKYLPPGEKFKKHPCVRFMWKGEEIHFMLPGSPGDRMGPKACRTRLRKVLSGVYNHTT